MVEAIKEAVRGPGRPHRATQTPRNLLLTAMLQKGVAREPEAGYGEPSNQFWRRVEQSDKELSASIEAVAEASGDYESKRTAARKLIHTFKVSLAKLLQAPLNDHLKTLPQATTKEKQTLATWLNEQLREFGLAIKCPKTNRPSILIADKVRKTDERGRFRLENRDEANALVRTSTSRELPAIELIEDSPRTEGMVDFLKRKRAESSRTRE